MEVKVGQSVLFSEFVGFLSRNRNSRFVSLCIHSRAEPYPFTLPCAVLTLRRVIPASLAGERPQPASCYRRPTPSFLEIPAGISLHR